MELQGHAPPSRMKLAQPHGGFNEQMLKVTCDDATTTPSCKYVVYPLVS